MLHTLLSYMLLSYMLLAHTHYSHTRYSHHTLIHSHTLTNTLLHPSILTLAAAVAISDFCWAPEDAVAETLKSLHQNEGAQLGAFYTSCVPSSTSDSLVEQIDQTETYLQSLDSATSLWSGACPKQAQTNAHYLDAKAVLADAATAFNDDIIFLRDCTTFRPLWCATLSPLPAAATNTTNSRAGLPSVMRGDKSQGLCGVGFDGVFEVMVLQATMGLMLFLLWMLSSTVLSMTPPKKEPTHAVDMDSHSPLLSSLYGREYYPSARFAESVNGDANGEFVHGGDSIRGAHSTYGGREEQPREQEVPSSSRPIQSLPTEWLQGPGGGAS